MGAEHQRKKTRTEREPLKPWDQQEHESDLQYVRALTVMGKVSENLTKAHEREFKKKQVREMRKRTVEKKEYKKAKLKQAVAEEATAREKTEKLRTEFKEAKRQLMETSAKRDLLAQQTENLERIIEQDTESAAASDDEVTLQQKRLTEGRGKPLKRVTDAAKNLFGRMSRTVTGRKPKPVDPSRVKSKEFIDSEDEVGWSSDDDVVKRPTDKSRGRAADPVTSESSAPETSSFSSTTPFTSMSDIQGSQTSIPSAITADITPQQIRHQTAQGMFISYF